MTKTKWPYTPIKPTIPPTIHSGWTKEMRNCQDNGEHKRVVYAPRLAADLSFCEPAVDLLQPDAEARASIAKRLQTALFEATVADVYIRYLPCTGNGVGVHCLVRRNTGDGSTVYFRKIRGGGMDLEAAVMAGIPLWLPEDHAMGPDGYPTWLGGRPPIILTDHCGLYGVAHPFGETFSSLTLKGDELRQLGYVVL